MWRVLKLSVLTDFIYTMLIYALTTVHTHNCRQVPNLSHVHVFGLWEKDGRTQGESTLTQVELHKQKQIFLYSSSTWSIHRPLKQIPSACSCSTIPPPYHGVSKPYGTGSAEGLFPNGQQAKGDSASVLNAALRHSLPLRCSIDACVRLSLSVTLQPVFTSAVIKGLLPYIFYRNISSSLLAFINVQDVSGSGSEWVSERQTVRGCQPVWPNLVVTECLRRHFHSVSPKTISLTFHPYPPYSPKTFHSGYIRIRVWECRMKHVSLCVY